ncbi:hypothetical protein PGB90_005774 [Kerria lacca]
MVLTRRTIRTDSLNDNRMNNEMTPLKPLPEPSSILHVFLIILLNLCKKIVFFNTYVRILAYITCLFALSSITDVLPLPRYFTSNFFNQYFVKLGWFWTLFTSIPFVFMTSCTYCCGKKYMVYRHMTRLAIATFFWFFWVNFFIYIEKIYGYCIERRDIQTKVICTSTGFHWHGFDLSGHAFLLIYSNLILIEEARPILGWEGIQDLIRDESYARNNKLSSFGPLRNLNYSEFNQLEKLYEKYLPFVRINFFLITCISVIWDIMLLSTILYFHSMPEKLLSGIISIIIWYLTYKFWYRMKIIALIPPGEGTFSYFSEKEKSDKN